MGDEPPPQMRQIGGHTGAAWERGETGRPRGEHLDGIEPTDARDRVAVGAARGAPARPHVAAAASPTRGAAASPARATRGYGWLVGKINEKFTSATPRLFAKFNFRVKWFDGWENHKLLLDNYNSGPSAPFNSWVLLEKEAAGAGPSDTVRE